MSLISQATEAERMYGARASNYDNSWHPQYADRFAHVVNAQPGQQILDLCCGTGLDLIPLARALNTSTDPNDGGKIIGVDTTLQMLALAKGRLRAKNPELLPRVQLLHQNVLELDRLFQEPVNMRPHSFDTIVCSNAFVLFKNPHAAVAHWKQFLKKPVYAAAMHDPNDTHEGHESHRGVHHSEPGGKLVIDIPHEFAQRSGLAMERAALRMALRFPSNRSWVTSVQSFSKVLEHNNRYRVERVVELDHVTGRGTRYYTAHDVDALFDHMSQSAAFKVMADGAGPNTNLETVKQKAKPIFRDEFMKFAGEDGRILETDIMYVYVARLTS
ncbi:hypothetical protein Sste5346_002668 [Sporothrix stenoceras]|uniref:Methyltransferase domain-containing protein n=1 Tax=Sporothrix stenoceras TaxID=5173 RepID=A0ABR3ZHW2_9PEZI